MQDPGPIPLDHDYYLDGYVEPHTSWRQWALAVFTVLILGGALAGAATWGIANLGLPAEGDITGESPETVILGGQGPAVAATSGGRIIDLGCVLAGPVEAVTDGTGAFVVTRGGPRVACPQATFRNGMNLRWPVESTPDTVPVGTESGLITSG